MICGAIRVVHPPPPPPPPPLLALIKSDLVTTASNMGGQ